jgi:CSLREA domain-containing protein
MSRRNRGIIGHGSIFAAALVGIVAMVAAGVAEATPYTVNTTNDSSGAGNCSLRDAINAADGSPTSGSTCTTAGTGSDTITFSVTGTITLGSTLPTITDSGLTITGPNPASSAAITISGNNAVQIMSVGGRFGTLSLNYLTFIDGNANNGGAIGNGGMLTITDCTFSGNQAIFGGAIDNGAAALTIIGSTFSANSVNTGDGQNPAGGAIYNDQTSSTTITNSTFSNNLAQASGGVAFGGAIENLSFSSLTLINDTFSGNRATGGNENLGGAIDDSSGEVIFQGTILADSSPANCRKAPSGAEFADNGHNIADDKGDSCELTGTSRIITSDSAIGLASTPGNNGGPTETIALNPVSGGAYNFIPQANCTDSSGNQLTNDQRGDKRPVNGTCSAGAYQYEAVGAAPPPIDCSTATASDPNLTALLPVFFMPEYISGVNDSNGGYKLKITGVTQDKPVPRLLCPNAFSSGTTVYLRTNNEPLQPGPSGLLYSIEFTATDKATGASCTGAAPVCAQDIFHRGKACLAPLAKSYDATKCPK